MSAAHAPAGERVLLDADALQRTLHRIAHEIIEANERLDEIALIGIHTRGVFVAQRLRRLIEDFAANDGRARHRRHHLLPRRRPGAGPRGAAAPAAARPLDADRLPARGQDRASSSTTSSTPAARSAPPSRRCSTTAAPRASSSPSSATAATASFRSVPTTSARTCRRPAASASRCSCRGGRGRPGPADPGSRGGRASDRHHRHARGAAARARAEAAPALDRGPHARRRRAAARDRAQLRERARTGDEEAADAARPHGRQPVLRVVDAHVVELRARRQAALGRRDVDQGRRLLGRQGRVPEGHGADAERLRPGRDRDPPRGHRRAAARRRGHRRARRQRRGRQAPAPDAGAPRPVHDPAGAGPDRGPPRRDRRRRAPLPGRALRHPGARPLRRARHARRPADADPARDRGDGLRDDGRHRRDRRGRRRLRPAHAARADARGRELRARACASTRRSGASRPSGCGRARRSCTPGR